MSAVYLVDGKPHRICDCDTMSQACPRGRKRELQTCGFSQCLMPAPDVLVASAQSETASLGEAAIRELRGLEQTAIMLEKQAPELYPEVKDGKVHFGRAVMESAAEAIRQAWANVIAAGTKGGTNGS